MTAKNIDFEMMTKEKAINYCYLHKNEFITDFDDVDEGYRQFECLISILESGTISPSELPSYGMDYD